MNRTNLEAIKFIGSLPKESDVIMVIVRTQRTERTEDDSFNIMSPLNPELQLETLKVMAQNMERGNGNFKSLKN